MSFALWRRGTLGLSGQTEYVETPRTGGCIPANPSGVTSAKRKVDSQRRYYEAERGGIGRGCAFTGRRYPLD